jgi:hypothetical protein
MLVCTSFFSHFLSKPKKDLFTYSCTLVYHRQFVRIYIVRNLRKYSKIRKIKIVRLAYASVADPMSEIDKF